MKNNSFIKRFINDIDSFPVSVIESKEYNVSELRKILHLKELKEITLETDAMIQYVNSIDVELGKLLPEILKGNNLYKEYINIEQKIQASLKDDLYVYAKQSALSVKALILYKDLKFEEAINATKECIILNEYLVGKGFYTLTIRIYEQIKNISKIYHKANFNDKGVEIMSELFKYLYNGTTSYLIKYSNIFRHQDIWKKTPLLRESYANELFLIYLEEFMKNNQKNSQLDEMSWINDLDFDVFSNDRKFIYNWIYITKELHKENDKEYLESLEYFLDDDIDSYYDLLKVNLLLKFEKFVIRKRLQDNYVQNIQENIRFYFNNKLKISREKLVNIVNEDNNSTR